MCDTEHDQRRPAFVHSVETQSTSSNTHSAIRSDQDFTSPGAGWLKQLQNPPNLSHCSSLELQVVGCMNKYDME